MRGELKARMDVLAQEAEKRRRLAELRRQALRKTEFFKRKATLEPKVVYDLIRNFFKGFLEKDYEFTVGELRRELKNVYVSSAVRKPINDILDTLEAIEYRNVRLSHEDLNSILAAFEQIVKDLVRSHARSTSWWDRIRQVISKEKEPDVIIAELPAIEDDSAEHVRIRTLVERVYAARGRQKMRKARTAYKDLLDEYSRLPDSEKAQLYPILDQTYRDLTS